MGGKVSCFFVTGGREKWGVAREVWDRTERDPIPKRVPGGGSRRRRSGGEMPLRTDAREVDSTDGEGAKTRSDRKADSAGTWQSVFHTFRPASVPPPEDREASIFDFGRLPRQRIGGIFLVG